MVRKSRNNFSTGLVQFLQSHISLFMVYFKAVVNGHILNNTQYQVNNMLIKIHNSTIIINVCTCVVVCLG